MSDTKSVEGTMADARHTLIARLLHRAALFGAVGSQPKVRAELVEAAAELDRLSRENAEMREAFKNLRAYASLYGANTEDRNAVLQKARGVL